MYISGVVCGGAVVCSTFMWCGGCNYVVVMLFVPSREHYQHQVTHKYKSLQHGNNHNVRGISFASCCAIYSMSSSLNLAHYYG